MGQVQFHRGSWKLCIKPHPSASHELTKVVTAIETRTGFTPQLVCRKIEGYEAYELLEIRICYKMNGVDIMNCPQPHQCPEDIYWLPGEQ